MRIRLPNIIPIFSLLIVFSLGIYSFAISTVLTPNIKESAYVVLDKMEAEYHPANKVVIVKGSIKNVSKIVLRGYISLHILNSNGSRLYTTEMAVKNHQPIISGEVVEFDTVVNVSHVKGASQISADFTWD